MRKLAIDRASLAAHIRPYPPTSYVPGCKGSEAPAPSVQAAQDALTGVFDMRACSTSETRLQPYPGPAVAQVAATSRPQEEKAPHTSSHICNIRAGMLLQAVAPAFPATRHGEILFAPNKPNKIKHLSNIPHAPTANSLSHFCLAWLLTPNDIIYLPNISNWPSNCISSHCRNGLGRDMRHDL